MPGGAGAAGYLEYPESDPSRPQYAGLVLHRCSAAEAQFAVDLPFRGGYNSKEEKTMPDVIKQIRNNTRRHFSADDKIRIVVESLRGEIPISELCRREGIQPSLFYRWSKQFLEAGKNGLTRETVRNASDDEVRELKSENQQLKIALAEAHLEVLRYKKILG